MKVFLRLQSDFIAFFVNDIYGFINWHRMGQRQGSEKLSKQYKRESEKEMVLIPFFSDSIYFFILSKHHNLITSLYKCCHLLWTQWFVGKQRQIIQLLTDQLYILAALFSTTYCTSG